MFVWSVNLCLTVIHTTSGIRYSEVYITEWLSLLSWFLEWGYAWLWLYIILPSVLWRCWLGGRKGIRPVKNWVVGCWRGCLGWGADLHIAQQMPLPLTISCCSKSRLVLTFLVLPFWYRLTRVVPDIFQKSSKMVVCVCVYIILEGSDFLENKGTSQYSYVKLAALPHFAIC